MKKQGKKYYLGIDLGGTNIAAALVGEHYQILQRAGAKTNAPRPVEVLCQDMADICEELTQKEGISIRDLAWIGLGTPGIVWNGVVCYSSNLDLRDAPMGRLLSEKIGRPVFLCNDASAAAYGEYLAGVGKKSNSLAMVTIGTGIGSGIILDGHIHSGFNGAAPELGHMIIVPNGRACNCGNHGCFEAYCSATGLIFSAKEAMRKFPQTMMWELAEGNIESVNGKIPFEAMAQGDNIASDVISRFLDYFAIGVANVINLIQPEMLCIGGGMSAQGDVLLSPLRDRVPPLTFAGMDSQRTELAIAQLGNDAGIIGAAMLGKPQA